MDRAAITRHLLSDAQDPYNRKPLTVEMLQPDDALRGEIEKWIRYVWGMDTRYIAVFYSTGFE